MYVVDAEDLARVLRRHHRRWVREHEEWELHFSTWLAMETVRKDPDHIGISERRVRTLIAGTQVTVGLWTADLVLTPLDEMICLTNGEVRVFPNPRRRPILESVENNDNNPVQRTNPSGR